MRHSIRADCEFECAWWSSTESSKWPADPPLTQSGIELAQRAAEQLYEPFKQYLGDEFSEPVVVSSPYFRCVQTAVELAAKLGVKVPILVDQQAGEVFGPPLVSYIDPAEPHRPLQDSIAYARSRGVDVWPVAAGKLPDWPESLLQARRRYVKHFISLLKRSLRVRRNFILVTHAEAVASTLSVIPFIPSECTVAGSVDYCGRFIAYRRLRPEGSSPRRECPAQRCTSEGPAAEAMPDVDMEEASTDSPPSPIESLFPRTSGASVSAKTSENLERPDQPSVSAEPSKQLEQRSQWVLRIDGMKTHKETQRRRHSLYERNELNPRLIDQELDEILGGIPAVEPNVVSPTSLGSLYMFGAEARDATDVNMFRHLAVRRESLIDLPGGCACQSSMLRQVSEPITSKSETSDVSLDRATSALESRSTSEPVLASRVEAMDERVQHANRVTLSLNSPLLQRRRAKRQEDKK